MPVDNLDFFLIMVTDSTRDHRIARWRAVDPMARAVLIICIVRLSFLLVLFLTERLLSIADLLSQSKVLKEVLLVERVVRVDFRLLS